MTSFIGERFTMGGGFGGRGGRMDFQPSTDENGNFVKPGIPKDGFEQGKRFN